MNDIAVDRAGLAQGLVQRRRAKGWTAENLAAHTGVSLRTVEMLEAGHREGVALEDALRLADALDTTVDDLLHDADLTSHLAPGEEALAVYREMQEQDRRVWMRLGRCLVQLNRPPSG